MNPFRHLLFILRHRRVSNRVAFSAYLKGYEKIELGRNCKIHVDASMDASRSPGVHIISYQHQYARGATIRLHLVEDKQIYIGRDCRLGANSMILAGVNIGDGPVVAGVPASIKKTRE